MKTTIFILSIILLYGCSIDDQSLLSDSAVTDEAVTRAITPVSSPVVDWEDITSIMLDGYGNRILPWYNASDTNIPNELLEDYKKEDGWEMIYNLCTPSVATTYGKYYLIFYNKLRGILRVFYYSIYDSTPATTTFWQLSFTRPTSMLNSVGHFTIPLHTNSTLSTYTTNISSVEAKGISRGWNCFDVELCYDPNSTSTVQKMAIRSYDVTQGTITLNGSLQMNSEGTIISTNMAPRFPVLSDMTNTGVSGFGGAVKKMVSKKLDSAKFSPLISMPIADILSGGTAGLIKSGINLLFGSFLGKQTTTTQTLKVRTTGQIKNDGEFTINSNSNLTPIVNLVCPGSIVESTDYFLPSYNEPLGVWNLAETPVVALSSGAIWSKYDDESMYSYTRLVRANPVNVIVNPVAMKYFSKYEVLYTLMYYEKLGGDLYWGKNKFFPGYYYTNSRFATPIVGKEVCRDDDGNVFLDDPHCSYDKVDDYNFLAKDYGRRHKEVWFLDDIPIENPNYVVKVMVTFYPKAPYDTTPIVSSRTYIPQYITDKNLIDPNGW